MARLDVSQSFRWWRRWKPIFEIILILLMTAVSVTILFQALYPQRRAESTVASNLNKPPTAARSKRPLPADPLPLHGAPSKGSAKARLVIVEFSDFHCPFCAKFAQQTLSHLDQKYLKKEIAQMVFRHFPLDTLHPNAFRAAELAHCAHRQNRFWEVHDFLFRNPKGFMDQNFISTVSALVADRGALFSCLGAESAGVINRDLRIGAEAGVTGTPTFFLGFRRPDGTMAATERLSGAATPDVFDAAIDKLLRDKPK